MIRGKPTEVGSPAHRLDEFLADNFLADSAPAAPDSTSPARNRTIRVVKTPTCKKASCHIKSSFSDPPAIRAEHRNIPRRRRLRLDSFGQPNPMAKPSGLWQESLRRFRSPCAARIHNGSRATCGRVRPRSSLSHEKPRSEGRDVRDRCAPVTADLLDWPNCQAPLRPP